MNDLALALGELLDRRVGVTSAGIALCIDRAPAIEVVWRPRGSVEEPGFLAYSVTKTFSAALALSLEEEDRLELDAPVSRWLPRSESADRITLRQLLNHTAGVPDYGGLPAYHDAVRSSPTRPWSFDRFAAETIEKGLLFEPGTRFAYSNPGYMLVRHLLEQASGQRYAELVAQRISRPLCLERTFVAASQADLASLAPAPSRLLSRDGELRDTRAVYHPGWVSHGVVASTASELVRFFEALFGARIVSRASLAQMTALVPVPNAPPRWRRPGYGLGLMGDPESPWGAAWGHGGGGPGYNTSALHVVDATGRTLSACVMCSSEEDFVAEQLLFAALDLFGG